MNPYQKAKEQLQERPRHWLVTGAAGFIGSHLVESLLKLNQYVIGLDNFSTGKPTNLEEVKASVLPEQWARFRFIHGDITDFNTCLAACREVEIVLHQAALGSVPRSIADPIATHTSNVTGFINMLEAARLTKVQRFVYASSSSVYGDENTLPKVENRIGNPLSPYAATKLINEIYAKTYARTYNLKTIGLRYFNVFGPRQDPQGPYAAVIPKWISAIAKGLPVEIYGDGLTTRDFCYVANVIQANILAATIEREDAINKVYNIAVGEQTTLNKLYEIIVSVIKTQIPNLVVKPPQFKDFRPGDIRHSQADISAARQFLGYHPTHTLQQGLQEAIGWYIKTLL